MEHVRSSVLNVIMLFYKLQLDTLNTCSNFSAEHDIDMAILCFSVVDVTLYAYFTLFDPLVYGIFLWKFLRLVLALKI